MARQSRSEFRERGRFIIIGLERIRAIKLSPQSSEYFAINQLLKV